MNKSILTSQSIYDVLMGVAADMRERRERGDYWEIEKDGTMIHKDPYYYIEGARLNDENWLTHMARKKWVDMKEFVDAYFTACRVRGLDRVSIRTDLMW